MVQRGSATPDTVAHFDRIADRYQGYYEENGPVGYSFTVRRERVLELFDADGGKVLDVGCGPGVMAHAVIERGCEFWGVDPSVRMIELAQTELAPSTLAHFQVGTASSLDYADGSFDAVICMGVLERISDDNAALVEMSRVLKPGGILIVTVPNKWSPALLWRDTLFYPVADLLRPIYRKRSQGDEPPTIRGHRRYSSRAFCTSFSRIGCDVSDVEYVVFNLLPAPIDSLLPQFSTKLMRALERLHRGRLRWMGGAMVVKARKRSAVRA